ncbi:hypothetical protein QFZ65_003064 [Arthrobacter sp. B3I9]|nr:hypothetical protein [Arthrobacter sp. B3I9]
MAADGTAGRYYVTQIDPNYPMLGELSGQSVEGRYRTQIRTTCWVTRRTGPDKQTPQRVTRWGRPFKGAGGGWGESLGLRRL